jgi:cysteinyl-tRNA synthetase
VHENEIAQSETATGKPFVNYWMHGRFLRWDEDDRRMSKSSGDFIVVGDLVARGFDPLAFRYLCLTASYRVPLTFSWEALAHAADSLRRLRENVRRLAQETHEAPGAPPPPALVERFQAAIADDLNLPGALAVVWETLRQANKATEASARMALRGLVLDFDQVLGLRLADAASADAEMLPADVADLIQRREAARAARDWLAADALREEIRRRGYEVEDTSSGTRWRQSGRYAPAAHPERRK